MQRRHIMTAYATGHLLKRTTRSAYTPRETVQTSGLRSLAFHLHYHAVEQPVQIVLHAFGWFVASGLKALHLSKSLL